MATERKDVELILRAKDMSSKSFTDVAAAVAKVTSALDDQVDAARRGDASASELKDSLKQLELAGQALLKQQALIDLYRRMAEQLNAAQAGASKSRQEFQAFAAQLDAAGESTKKQQAQLERMQKSADNADKKVSTLTTTLGAQGERLAQVGIDTRNLETAQNALVSTAQRTGAAMATASTAVDGYAVNLRKLRDTQKAAADETAFQKQLTDASNLAKASEYVSWWSRSLDAADASEKKLAEQHDLDAKAQKELATFRELADQATATARGYNTLGDASVKLAQASSQISPSIRSILDPAGAARDTISGLETQINGMASAITAIRGPVADYTGTLKSLQAAQRAIGNQAEAIDAYQQQIAAVRAARAEFVEARAQVTQYAAAIRAATAPNDELAAGLKRAEAALAAAQRQLQSQVNAARQSQQALRGAGVETQNLADEEQRLAAAARTTVSATENLSAAVKRYGAATDDAGKNTKSLNEGSRESLSWYQRVRGEVIALATAYVGLQGAIGLARAAVEAYISKQGVENRLAIVVGNDPTKIGQEWDYVHGQAVRLGVGINELADSYSRFAIAAKNGNLTADQTRFAFERISEVMRVNHASTDQISGAFYQLEQMLSKNRVQMDDLRQASNWIPGLETMLSRGLGLVNVQQLFEQMKKGSVDAKTAVLALGQEMEKEYGDRVPASLKSLQAEQGRFQTAVSDFERSIANGGFADAYTALLQKVTAVMGSDQGSKFAESLSTAFTAVVNVLSAVVDHGDELIGLLNSISTILNVIANNAGIIIPLMEAAFGLKVLGWIRGVTLGLGGMAQAALATAAGFTDVAAAEDAAAVGAGAVGRGATIAAGGVTFLGTALKGVTKLFGWLNIALVAWDIATVIYDKFEGVRKVIDKAVVNIKANVSTIRLAMSTSDPAEFKAGVTGIEADRQKALTNVNAGRKADDDGTKANAAGQTQSQLKALDALAAKQKEINDILDQRTKQIDDIRVKRAAGAITQKQAEDDATKAFASFGPQIKDATNAAIVFAKTLDGSVPVDKMHDFISHMEGLRGVYEPNLGDNDEKMAKRRETLESQLSESLRQIDAKTERQQKDSLDARLKAVDDTYEKIFKKVAEFQKDGGTEIEGKPIADYTAQLNASKEMLKQQETAKYNTDQLKEKEQAVNDAIKERNDTVKSINEQVSSGSISALDGYQKTRAELDKMQPKIKALADDAQRFAEGLRGQGVVPDTKIDALSAKMDRASPNSSVDTSETLLKQFEGFQQKAKYDANAYRAGYGSDTVTLADGSIQKITQGMSVSLDDANRDLARRIGEFQTTVQGQVGEDRFNSFSTQQQAALTSVAYNYGSLPDRIIGAVKTGTSQQIADAIRGLAGDNGGINSKRRNTEASLFSAGGSGSTGAAAAPSAAAAATGGVNVALSDANDQKVSLDLVKKGYEDLNNVIQQRNSLVTTYNQLAQTGSITQIDAQDKIKKAYADTQPTITQMTGDLETLLKAMAQNGDITSNVFDTWAAKLKLVQAQSQNVDANFTQVKQTLSSAISNGAVTAFDSIGQSLANVIDQTESFGDAMKDIGNAALSFAANLLKQIANMILQMVIMNALKSSGMFNSAASGISSFAGAAASAAAVAHSGAVVGVPGGMSRSAPNAWFANAPRYHDGTVVGLKSDERTAILQTGEEVLARSDPRNIMNAVKNPPAAPNVAVNPRIVNVLDPSLVQDHLNSSAGESVLVNVIRRNAGSIKQILGGA